MASLECAEDGKVKVKESEELRQKMRERRKERE